MNMFQRLAIARLALGRKVAHAATRSASSTSAAAVIEIGGPWSEEPTAQPLYRRVLRKADRIDKAAAPVPARPLCLLSGCW